MRAVIVGCGRVGAGLAELMANAGHDVTILDVNTEAFSRLPSGFPGSAVRGDGTDEDVLRKAGAQGADWFFALTEGDNRNILTAQLANETLGIPQVVAKINDPVRSEAYRALGLNTICRTNILVDALARFASVPGPRVEVGVSRATGQHRGGEHHAVRAPRAGDGRMSVAGGVQTQVTEDAPRSPSSGNGREG